MFGKIVQIGSCWTFFFFDRDSATFKLSHTKGKLVKKLATHKRWKTNFFNNFASVWDNGFLRVARSLSKKKKIGTLRAHWIWDSLWPIVPNPTSLYWCSIIQKVFMDTHPFVKFHFWLWRMSKRWRFCLML